MGPSDSSRFRDRTPGSGSFISSALPPCPVKEGEVPEVLRGTPRVENGGLEKGGKDGGTPPRGTWTRHGLCTGETCRKHLLLFISFTCVSLRRRPDHHRINPLSRPPLPISEGVTSYPRSPMTPGPTRGPSVE